MSGSKQEKPLDRYVGALSADEIAAGINVAARNAARLASDARILLDAHRFPTAASIAALAIEEAGKVSILRRLSMARDEKEIKSVWREYRSHRAKSTSWILPDLVARGAISLNDFKDAVDQEGEHTLILDAVKQIGLYSDCYGDRHWSEPFEVVEESLARQLVMTAEVLSKRDEVSPREISLWKEILGPVWETPAMTEALLRWH
ncbi:AbiV family abortive infection protein [Thalassospiraceae bacterium LMO-SO8]|nr:AbiV family abortive infection protein [Alphaproteobacteria bacterium LMO-S08]WND77868.1 AbiV family abortive infection protein [Thalassospiraceae bacterium LMO-SO8]